MDLLTVTLLTLVIVVEIFFGIIPMLILVAVLVIVAEVVAHQHTD